jgi:hypothetical protein
MPSRLTRTVSRTLPLALICTILAGCPSRKPITSTSPAYRLLSIDGGSLLLSPNIPAQQSTDSPISFALDAKNNPAASPSTCSATEGPFRLEQDPHTPNLRVVLPSPKTWLFGFKNSSGSDENNTIESLYSFLADIDRAQSANCFASTRVQARDYILQSIPTRPSDSLFNAYGYRIERSGVNLKPSLRLKVERAYFRTREGGDSVKNYLGVSDVLFDVTPDNAAPDNPAPDNATPDKADALHFQQVRPIQYSPDSLAQTDHEGSRDLALLNLKPKNHYRVLFYTHQVPTDHNFSAAIIGADDTALLDGFEQSIRSDANASCSSSNHDGIECFDFQGFVTVTVQIPVELNGIPQFVDWGTKVRGVLQDKIRKSLKIQRRFADTYYNVNFKPTDNEILDLTLVGGDRLTWSHK